MKKIVNEQIKNLWFILAYWGLFVAIPFLITWFIKNNKYHDNDLPFWIIIYFLIVVPLLYFIPYKLAKPRKKMRFIVFGVILPYLFIYLFIYLAVRETFHPGF